MKENKGVFTVGKASFNVDNVKDMSEDEFVKQHKHLERSLPGKMGLKELYKKISGNVVSKSK